ncbi:MAG: hypothetical protein Q8928_11675 [Bacteroidota bacterium]|nr:hypothetical protein [Bacteroidota bacterium]
MNIQYVKHEDIDFQRWDRCIRKAVNGSIYGYSWYLNTVSKEWNALIDENYENVMPLTYRTILGIKMLIQPHLATNLGVYSSQVLDGEKVNSFIAAIPKEYRYVRINLNKYNKLSVDNIKVSGDIHYELDLIEPYNKIRSRYTKEAINAIKVAEDKNITIISGLNSADLIHIYQKNKGFLWNIFFRQRIATLKVLVSTAVRFRVGHIYGAYQNNNRLCAAAFFVTVHKRATLLFLGLDKEAIKNHVLEAIIDEFIKLHCEQDLTLRFEFASRKKYAGIYAGIGGRRYRFMSIQQNRLPWYLKFLKL